MPKKTVLRMVRYWLPAAVILGGVLSGIVIRTEGALEGAAGVVGAGLSILLLNALIRIGEGGDGDRDAEDEARRYFDVHGRWPDES
jgi:hypothetical protein